MKGKKIDNDFVVNFIEKCTAAGITDTTHICEWATSLISQIDRQIKEAEEAKIERSKILDVIEVLGKKIKDKSKDRELLKKYL